MVQLHQLDVGVILADLEELLLKSHTCPYDVSVGMSENLHV